MRKFILCALIFCLFLAGCGGVLSPGESTGGRNSQTGPAESRAPAGGISLLDGEGRPAYRIVRPDKSSETVKDAGVNLRLALNALTGAEFGITTDYLNTKNNETADGVYEILIGATNRAESAAASGGLGTYDYVICVSGIKIVIAGGGDYAVSKAAEAFLGLFAGGGPFLLAEDFRFDGRADGGGHLVGVTNQGESRIEVYDIGAGVLNASTRVFGVDMPYYNIAGLKLRAHEKWGEVVISACGGSYASIITYPEGKTVWSTSSAANNPHSVELIPGNIFVVASSTGAALRFFDLDGSADKYTEVAFPDAHGVLWDPENQLLWALGQNVLTAYRVSKSPSGGIAAVEATERRSGVPTGGGHDLAPVYGDKNQLWITTGSAVYRYDKAGKSFSTDFPGSDIIKRSGVKGIGSFADGSIVLVTPDGVFKSWTTATVDFYLADGTKLIHSAAKSPTGDFYKCRVWCSDYQ